MGWLRRNVCENGLCFSPSLQKTLNCVSDINLKLIVMRIISALANGGKNSKLGLFYNFFLLK